MAGCSAGFAEDGQVLWGVLLDYHFLIFIYKIGGSGKFIR